MDTEHLHGIAHDVRNDLSIIQAATASLKRLWPDQRSYHPEPRLTPQQLFSAVEVAISHSTALLMSLADGVIASGAIEGPTDMESTLRAAVGAFRPCLGTGQRLDFECQGQCMLLWASRAELVAVVLNLLKNAQEALGEERGRIVLRLRSVTTAGVHPRRYVRLLVADTGRGLDSTGVARATELGFSTKAAGRGFGLWRARRFVEALDGRLRFRSAPGRGTAVALCLPIALEPRSVQLTETSP